MAENTPTKPDKHTVAILMAVSALLTALGGVIYGPDAAQAKAQAVTQVAPAIDATAAQVVRLTEALRASAEATSQRDQEIRSLRIDVTRLAALLEAHMQQSARTMDRRGQQEALANVQEAQRLQAGTLPSPPLPKDVLVVPAFAAQPVSPASAVASEK